MAIVVDSFTLQSRHKQKFATDRFKNAVDKMIVYNLTIQRSTGRFIENFLEESQKTPFAERTGRCIRQQVE